MSFGQSLLLSLTKAVIVLSFFTQKKTIPRSTNSPERRYWPTLLSRQKIRLGFDPPGISSTGTNQNEKNTKREFMI